MYKFLTALPWIFSKVPQISHLSQSLCSFNFYGRLHCQERAGTVTGFNIYCIIHLPPCLLPFFWWEAEWKLVVYVWRWRRAALSRRKGKSRFYPCLASWYCFPCQSLSFNLLPKCVHGSVDCFSASSLRKISTSFSSFKAYAHKQ